MDNNQPKQLPYKREVLRKLTHLFAFVIPGSYLFIPLSKSTMLAIMIPVAMTMFLIDISRLRDWKLWHLLRRLILPVIRESEELGNFTGATYILATAALTIALFSPAVAILSLCYIIVGDPASALIGRRFGIHKFKNRSFEGSLAFLVACLMIMFIVPDISLTVRIIGALVATITEALSFNIDDNATVPLVSGTVMTILINFL